MYDLAVCANLLISTRTACSPTGLDDFGADQMTGVSDEILKVKEVVLKRRPDFVLDMVGLVWLCMPVAHSRPCVCCTPKSCWVLQRSPARTRAQSRSRSLLRHARSSAFSAQKTAMRDCQRLLSNKLLTSLTLQQVMHMRDFILYSYGEDVVDRTSLRTSFNTNKGYKLSLIHI